MAGDGPSAAGGHGGDRPAAADPPPRGPQAATIASTGQTALQADSPPLAAHSSHSVASMTYVSSAALIALLGHSGSQAAQTMHSLARIVLAIQGSSLDLAGLRPARVRSVQDRRRPRRAWAQVPDPACATPRSPAGGRRA